MSRRVLAFGTFDVLHPGHRDFFSQAKALGEKLVVVVALDETVLALKGRLPHDRQDVRLANVQACDDVDEALFGRPGDKYAIVQDIKPDIIALGYDQGYFADALPVELQKRGIKAAIVRLKAFHPDQYKSSLLLGQK